MSYEWIAFGAPWKLPYETYEADVPHKSVTGMQMPFGVAARLLFSPSRGLLLVSPVILVAVGCAIWLARRDERPEIRTHARVGLAVCGLYLLAVASARATNVQEIPGPRFLIVAIPFVAVPLAAGWERIRVVAILAAVWGAIVMSLATVTSLLVGDGEPLFHAYRARLTRPRLPSDTVEPRVRERRRGPVVRDHRGRGRVLGPRRACDRRRVRRNSNRGARLGRGLQRVAAREARRRVPEAEAGADGKRHVEERSEVAETDREDRRCERMVADALEPQAHCGAVGGDESVGDVGERHDPDAPERQRDREGTHAMPPDRERRREERQRRNQVARSGVLAAPRIGPSTLHE